MYTHDHHKTTLARIDFWSSRWGSLHTIPTDTQTRVVVGSLLDKILDCTISFNCIAISETANTVIANLGQKATLYGNNLEQKIFKILDYAQDTNSRHFSILSNETNGYQIDIRLIKDGDFIDLSNITSTAIGNNITQNGTNAFLTVGNTSLYLSSGSNLVYLTMNATGIDVTGINISYSVSYINETNTTSNKTNTVEHDANELSTGVIVGIAIGSTVGAGLLGLAGYYIHSWCTTHVDVLPSGTLPCEPTTV